MLDCLTNIVGLSETSCACFEDGKPVEDVSLSGFYIADHFHLSMNFTNSATDCEQGGVWDILEAARKEAILRFQNDYAKGMMMIKRYKYEDFSGEIGSRKFNAGFTPTQNFVGLRIRPYCIIGSKLRIDAVILALRGLSVPVSVPVSIYSSLDFNTPIATTTVNLVASNQFVRAEFARPVVLELNTPEEDTNYYVVFELPAGLQVPNSEIKKGCTCNARAYYRQNKFLQYGDFNGFEVANIADLDNSNTRLTNKNYGLLLEGSLQCDYISQLCTLASSFSFDVSVPSASGKYYHLGSTLALIIGHKAAEIAADKILMSTNINQIVLTRREELEKIKYMNRAKYEKALKFFVNNLPTDFTDCFTCKQPSFASISSMV